MEDLKPVQPEQNLIARIGERPIPLFGPALAYELHRRRVNALGPGVARKVQERRDRRAIVSEDDDGDERRLRQWGSLPRIDLEEDQ